MHHGVFGRKLHRTKNERHQLFGVLLRNLIAHDSVTTTQAKAKAVQPSIEKLITMAKKGKSKAVLAEIDNGALTEKLMSDAKDRFASRTSGYTRIIKLGKRVGDNTEVVRLSFVDTAAVRGEVVSAPEKTEPSKKGKIQAKTALPKVKK